MNKRQARKAREKALEVVKSRKALKTFLLPGESGPPLFEQAHRLVSDYPGDGHDYLNRVYFPVLRKMGML